MIADGVMDGPKVDLALGFHNHPDMPVGSFGFVHGAGLAAADRFDIVVHGKSGHAAYPHHHGRSDRRRRAAGRPVADGRLARGAADHAGGGHRRLHPGRHDLQHHPRQLRRSKAPSAPCTRRRATPPRPRSSVCAAGMREGMRVACEVDYRRGVPCCATTTACWNPPSPRCATVRRRDRARRAQPRRRGLRADGRTSCRASSSGRIGAARAQRQAAQFRLPAGRTLHRLRRAGTGARRAGTARIINVVSNATREEYL